ncbi:hypothetical protein [Salinibacter ruber]|jgi:hypothetical protein|uniref:DUF8139 domain-containing protein n=1 Tax=Salinibacter ruber TaxID=146919 RepID=A0A9X2TKG5_9BACT|nr:hypothetical protein [Salinibacter ruber]MCS3661822.1 hypothetical protein [Salinibacter ruber]MCS3711629.1 hypothetical protein [Salinibacter ruber]
MALSVGERVEIKPRKTTTSQWHGLKGTITKVFDDDMDRPFEVKLDEKQLGQVQHFQFEAGDLISLDAHS